MVAGQSPGMSLLVDWASAWIPGGFCVDASGRRSRMRHPADHVPHGLACVDGPARQAPPTAGSRVNGTAVAARWRGPSARGAARPGDCSACSFRRRHRRAGGPPLPARLTCAARRKNNGVRAPRVHARSATGTHHGGVVRASGSIGLLATSAAGAPRVGPWEAMGATGRAAEAARAAGEAALHAYAVARPDDGFDRGAIQWSRR